MGNRGPRRGRNGVVALQEARTARIKGRLTEPDEVPVMAAGSRRMLASFGDRSIHPGVLCAQNGWLQVALLRRTMTRSRWAGRNERP